MLNNQKPTRIFSVSVFLQILTITGDMVSFTYRKRRLTMTDLSRKILDSYQIRKTKKQKDAFIALMQAHFPAISIQEKGVPKSRNLILGDPETAKVVLGAHYDTCAQLPFPNFIMPKCPLLTIGYSLLILIPMVVLIFLANWLLNLFTGDAMVHYWVSLLVYLLFFILLLAGPANKHTANDNTSGVITLLEIYEKLSEEDKQKVCFVFFDNEEAGLLGSAQFRKVYKKQMKETLLINFDCVSDGDTFLLGITKQANQKYHVPLARVFTSTEGKAVLMENLKKVYYPSDQAGFPMAIAVAALKHKKPFGYYMDRIHTNRDTVFEERNIEYLAERTGQFVSQI